MGHSPSKPVTILVVGPSTAGKTCLVTRLSSGSDTTQLPYTPTVGVNTASLSLASAPSKEAHVAELREVSGNWPWVGDLLCAHHLDDSVRTILFVVDSTLQDEDRVAEGRSFLERVAKEEAASRAILVIVAAKADSEGALPADRLMEMYNAVELLADRTWSLKAVSSRTGAGVDALVEQLRASIAAKH